MVDRTQKQRIREEVIAILSEERPLKAVRRLAELNELRFIAPCLKLTKSIVNLFDSVDEALAWYDAARLKRRHGVNRWLIYLGALLDELSLAEAQKICDEFVFMKADCAKLISYKKTAEKALLFLSKKEKLNPSQIYDCLEGLSTEVLLLMMAKSGFQTARRRIMDYLIKYVNIKLSVRGDDFTKKGIRPGPHFRQVLKRTLHAKLDSKIKTKAEELDSAMRYFKG